MGYKVHILARILSALKGKKTMGGVLIHPECQGRKKKG